MRNFYLFSWKTFLYVIHTVLEAVPFSSVTTNLQANSRAIFGNVFDLHKKEDTPVLNKNKQTFSFKLLFEIS